MTLLKEIILKGKRGNHVSCKYVTFRLTKIMAAKLFRVDSTVGRHHVYNRICTPTIAEELQTHVVDKDHDTFAVSVLKGGIIVGHMPREISPVLLTRTITCKIK